MKIEFGWYPYSLDGVVGDIAITTLPNLEKNIARVRESSSVDDDWIYAQRQLTHDLNHSIIERPYPNRIFGLPKTHLLTHDKADTSEHLDFLVWALSFFVGMRLTTTEAGFLDASPLRRGTLVDFILSPSETFRAMAFAEAFWQANKTQSIQPKRWIAALHALYLGQYPLALQVEEFCLLYSALDTCFKLVHNISSSSSGNVVHSKRVRWMCDHFSIPTPIWADDAAGFSKIAEIRNEAIHEGLFIGKPLGFALYGVGTNENITLEMKALVCRVLVALMGDPNSYYVRSPVNTCETYRWSPTKT